MEEIPVEAQLLIALLREVREGLSYDQRKNLAEAIRGILLE